MAIIIPETILYDFVASSFSIIKKDYESSEKSKSFLYFLFGKTEDGDSLAIETMNFFDQAVAMFTKEKGDQRILGINLGYNLQRAQTPTIHIMMPNESPHGAGIGRNEGYVPAVVDDVSDESYNVANTNYNATYNMLITSNNSAEVVIIYNLLKSVFLARQVELELQGLLNCTFGGSDVTFQDDMIPVDIFHRNFNVSFEYENNVRDIFSMKIASDFKIGDMSNSVIIPAE